MTMLGYSLWRIYVDVELIGVKSISKEEEEEEEEEVEDEEWEERESRSSKTRLLPYEKNVTHLNESIQFQGCQMISKS